MVFGYSADGEHAGTSERETGMKMIARSTVVRVTAALAAALCASSALADGFRNPPPGAAGLGRGNAFAAQADDASAVSYNPANLGFLTAPEAEVSLTLASMETEVRSIPPGYSAASDDSWQVLPNVFVALPLTDSVVGGLGLTTPFGQSVEWEQNSYIAMTSPYFAQMALLNVNPSAGWRINDRVAVGAGVDVFLSTLEFRQIVAWSALPGFPAGLPPGEARVETSGAGIGANIGLTVKLADAHRLALTYRSPVTVEYEGDFDLRGAPAVPGLANSDFETEMEFPGIATIGYGIELTDTVRVEANVEWLGWSAMESLPIDAGANQPLADPSGTGAIPYDWDDTWTFNIGGDWACAANWVLRAGYSYIPTPIPNSTFSPLLPDEDRHVIAVGAGYHKGGHAVDVVWTLSLMDERTVTGNPNPAFNGVYDIDPQLVAVSYRYRFN
jgi:long-chain fatty acid transport protein